MALSEGMVAVVRSAEAPGGLCVTLMEGNRQYTIMPNSEVPLRMQSNPDPCPRKTQSTSTQQFPTNYNEQERHRNVYDSSTQAMDGQYASIYKMAHCNLHPTSPSVELSEFPPQRPGVYPGQENFLIGGCSSRNTNQSPPRNNTNFRMGTNWPAQGAPAPRCPRTAHRPDAFSKSLRNYPSLSPERSGEVVERLINYSNMRNNKLSPERLLMPKNPSQCSKCSTPMTECFKQIDSKNGRPRAEIYDESPTRDRWQCGEEKESLPTRCDVRSMTNEKYKDFQRVVSSYPDNLCPSIMERLNHIPSKFNNNMPAENRNNFVNMETQAAVPTVSREMATIPRPPPEVRNVAVFVSPTSSSPCNSDSQHRRLKIIRHSKSISIQTQISDVLKLRRKSVQTCFSSVNLRNNKKIGHKRRSKSQVELKIDYDLDEQIVQIIHDLSKPSAHLRSELKKARKQKHDKHEPKVKIDKCENEPLLLSKINLKEFTRELSNDLLSKIKRQNIIIQPTDLYRANYFDLLKTNYEHCITNEIVVEWLKDIPIKRTDYLGRPVLKENILETVGDKVHDILINKLKYSEASTKADIIDILEDMPIDVTGHTRRSFLNKLVTELTSKVKIWTSKNQWKKLPDSCNYVQSTDEEVKQSIENGVADLQRKFSLLICHDTVGHMIYELTAIVLDSMEAIKRGNIRDVIDEVLRITSEFLSISEFQSIYFAHNLVFNLFQQSYCNEPQSCHFLCYNSKIQQIYHNNADSSVENETEHENSDNRSSFAGQIAIQVNEWLSSIKGIEKLNPSSRRAVVSDLTGDIVDRQKYLKVNQSLPNSGNEELEHLKYQIFKWVNKVLGEDNMDTLAKAPNLLTRIKGIRVTQNESQEERVMSKPTDHSSNVPNEQPRDSRPDGQPNESSIRPAVLRSATVPSANVPNEQRGDSRPNQTSTRPVVLRSPSVPSAAQNKSIKQLNEEYDAYVKDWVQRVPIAVAKPKDEAIAEKARLGLYIGVWKAITKLKMSPELLDNPYHYQDALDDELEILLQCLPQTREFKTKKHVLKPDLIEKTMIFNERVANVAGSSSYRQQLVDNVNNSLPKPTEINTAGKNGDRLYEEWEKNVLAEYYILYNRFKIDDRVKAIAYKKKLMRHIEKMIDNIKATTRQELKELDYRTYEDEILTALDEVPIPSDETLNEEAGEILILLEVEQWFGDLPLLPSKKEATILEVKVFQDLLARKLYDIDAHCDPTKRTDLIKQEIRRFLERLPLREEEKPNMNFMIEELLNRLNNINSDVVVVGGENERKPNWNFLEGYDYDAFSRNLPVSSTFEGNPPRDPDDGSSYLISEGARVPEEQGWQMIRDPTGISEQYLTIEGLTGPRMPSAPPTPQNGDVPPSNQFQSPNQGPFRTEQTMDDSRPGSGNGTRNGQASSRSIQIMDDPVSNLRNQNQSGYVYPAEDYDPNRLQPPPIDINKTAMPQQYRTSPMPDCCGLPTPQDNERYATPRQQVNGAYTTPRPQGVDCCDQYHMPIPQDYGAYGMSKPQNTPQDLRNSGTCPMQKTQQSGTSAMPTSQDYRPCPMPRTQQSGTNGLPTPQDCRASAMPRPPVKGAYSMSGPQYGTYPMPRSLPPGCCATPRFGASDIPRPQEQRASVSPSAPPLSPIDNRCSGRPTPQNSSTPQDLRTTEQGTNPKPRTLDSGTTPVCYKSMRWSSAPPSYRPSRSQYHNDVPPTPDPYTPYSTPDNETPQTPIKCRKERRDSARRKLRFDETENDSDTDFGCRCMEKIWRCSRSKPLCEMRGYIPCEEMPCFMRMRKPYYFRS